MRRRPSSIAVATAALLTALLAGVVIAGSAPTSAAPKRPTTTTNATPDATTSAVAPGLPQPPVVAAKAWYIHDAATDELLAGEDAETPRAIASLTKLMTALVVVEATKGNENVHVTRNAVAQAEGSGIGMRAGQTYPVDTLLKAMLVYSANDAAVALAEYVSGSEQDFIAKMNERATELGLSRTRFTTVNGLDETRLTTSTPVDLVELAKVVLRDERVASAVKLPQVRIDRASAGPITLPNRNRLLGAYAGVDGVKTGYTVAAGNCLLTHWASPEGADIYVVVLGEPDDPARFSDTRLLLDWVQQVTPRLTLTDAGEKVASVPVAYRANPVAVYVEDAVAVRARIGADLRERWVLPARIDPPLRPGDTVGRYELLVDGKVTASSALYINTTLTKPGRLDRWTSYLDYWDVALRVGWREVTHQVDRSKQYWGADSP